MHWSLRMTDREIFNAGVDAYHEGQKAIPSAAITAIRPTTTKEYHSSSRIWLAGWYAAKDLAEKDKALDKLEDIF